MTGGKEVLRYYLSDEARAAGVEFKPPRELDAGFDLPCFEDTLIEAKSFCAVRTGLHLAIPENWVGIVKDRSSVALRGGVVVAGVIDSAYRGEVKVLMYNLGEESLVFEKGDRVAQCVIMQHLPGAQCLSVERFEDLGDTSRGEGGFGSTGK